MAGAARSAGRAIGSVFSGTVGNFALGIIGGAVGFAVTGGNPYGAIAGFQLAPAEGTLLFPNSDTARDQKEAGHDRSHLLA